MIIEEVHIERVRGVRRTWQALEFWTIGAWLMNRTD